MQSRFYLSLLLLILTGIILCYGCGGGDNSGIVPNNVINPNTTDNQVNNIISTTTPVLVTKPAQGYLIVTNSVTDEGDNVENLDILDVPANNIDETGNQTFIQQVADTLKEDPLIWNSPQMQDLYNTLNPLC